VDRGLNHAFCKQILDDAPATVALIFLFFVVMKVELLP